ncbi:hypothetical protein [Mycolicibacterium fortuitum]|uniref:hypothetical protein n=1 Tax=Mycolicibacterium fortuitum TaxID=1766 RepID=UPI0007E98E48|nr:hypothetical protein [Mycolicibacterium fortuitum]OBB45675.1 hypothetical protein A5754_09100 [Mycolicibacterium fortuitum]OBB76270.1 hypothetical protein A5755_13200 [Mycolicibacterium fortuitum]OBF89692.1 hypothetical protein A5751_00025 [Mycolicibacterium fortuitum]
MSARFDSATLMAEACSDGKVHIQIVAGGDVRVGFEIPADEADRIADGLREKADLARRLAVGARITVEEA